MCLSRNKDLWFVMHVKRAMKSCCVEIIFSQSLLDQYYHTRGVIQKKRKALLF